MSCNEFRIELTFENLNLRQMLTIQAQVARGEKGGSTLVELLGDVHVILFFFPLSLSFFLSLSNTHTL